MRGIANKIEQYPTSVKLGGFLLLLLLAYTWAQPFREIYGLEARNALMAREMLEDGPGLVPTALGRPYPDYPPLYFWMAALCSMPSGRVSPMSATLPSALCAVGIAGLTFLLGRRIHPAAGWLASLILATMPPFWLNACRASIDMLLAFNVTAALFFFHLGDRYHRSGKGKACIAAASVFAVLAFLSKGPVGIVLPAVSWGGYLLWEKQWKKLVRFSLLVLALGIACAALGLAFAYHAGGRELVENVVFKQLAGRIATESRKPAYYYFVCLLEIGGPWWVLIAASFLTWKKSKPFGQNVSRLKRLTGRHAEIRLSLAWFVGILAVFTVASTKKGRYILPLYPALALLIAAWVRDIADESRKSAPSLSAKSINAGAVVLMLAGTSIFFFYPDIARVPMPFIFIWLAGGVAGLLIVSKTAEPNFYSTASVLHLLFVGLVGANLLVAPTISREASGQSFVKLAESKVDPSLPLVVYGIRPDGDGVKFALHSERKPASIRFVDTEDAQALSDTPYLLIANAREISELRKRLPESRWSLIGDGSIRSHRFAAYFIED